MRAARPSAFRRTRRVALGLATAGLVTTALTQPGAAAPSVEGTFSPGTGNAIAIAYKVNPVFGNLSFGITAGESVAGHQNTGAQAQSKAVNLGVIGVTLAGEGCKGADPTLPSEQQPQPVIVGSEDPGADKGVTNNLASAITMSARATKAPFSEAITSVAPLGDPTVIEISGGTSHATSGIVAPGVREARAISDIAEVRLLRGSIVIKGMHWEAVQRTGASTVNTGSFTLGALVVGGQETPLPQDGLAQLGLLRDVLQAAGLTIKAPTVRFEQGIEFVDPMTIGIVPSALRDGLLGAVLSAANPVRQVLVDAINSIGCEGANNILGNNGKTAITVLDLALASVSGAGYLTVELGGVQATTAEIANFSGLGVVPPLPALDSPLTGDLPSSSFDTGLPVGGVDDTPNIPPSGTDEQAAAPAKTIADVDGERGGTLLAIGAGGFLLLLATAEADRRKMRRAQREILLED